MNEKRIVLHVDMDHFFSAVEERENPSYKGKPVVVGSDPNEGRGRGVVKTCNYEARSFGIHSGMPISKAWKLCPHAIYVRGSYRLYKKVSMEIMGILRTHSDKFQQWGLDEAFLDVSAQVKNFDEATQLAEEIKREILEKVKLTCSIGVAPNKLVAKIASDFKKPGGLTVVTEDAKENFLAPLPVRKLLWIGDKTESKLNDMGIETIGDLAAFDVSRLVERFGTLGARYHRSAHGICESEVARRSSMIKSIGHQSTFETDTDHYETVLKKLDNICQRIHKKIVERKIVFKTVTVKIRYEDFRTSTHGKTLRTFTNRLSDLQRSTRELAQVYLRENRKIRLVGIRVSSLASNRKQRTLV